MKQREKKLTAAEVILLAANDLAVGGVPEFSEWQLSVATWKRDQSKFGMRGFESEHPDHKRVMKEIMGQAPGNPVHRGLLERIRPNYYRLTPVGRAAVAQFSEMDGGDATPRSAAALYDGIVTYCEHRVFQDWLKNPEEPRTWLGAAAFLQLSQHDPAELRRRLRNPVALAMSALEWLDENHREQINRGPAGGGRAIPRQDLQKLREFVGVLQDRFAAQIGAIQQRGGQLR